MDLSNDLISKFVKITNDDKNKNSESTVYGTVVEYNGGMYVRIDGSDLLTPVETTADFKPNERVTVMIKNHSATVTGNITSPATNEGAVTEKVTEAVEDVEGKVITEVEILIADRVSTEQLDAEVARIDELIAGKASVEDLTATNAEITNLKADKASIEDLTATNAEISNLKAKDAEIENLVVDKASIKDLTATNAEITNLKAKDAEIENLVADKASVEDLTATNARIDSLQANKADITYLDANFATIDELEATHADIEILDAELADINTLVNGNLTSDNISSLNITSQNTTMENAFVKDAMIDTVTANKIMSGTIDTNNVTIQSTDGSMLLQGTLLQMKDDNGKVRIQIGKDTGGNFTFILYDESGTGVLIDEEGIKSSDAIADGLIVDAKVADNANIAGSKLDIASVITEVNNDNSTTIKSNKIYLDEQGQSLEVAFNSLKTHVDTIQDVTIDGDLTVVKEQVQSNTTQIAANKEGISTLVSENTIRKEEIQNLDGEIESVNNTLSSKYSSLEQDVSGFKTTVAETYATKQSVTDVSNNLATNYSTTSAMNSAIQQKANEITSSVSSTYTTKTEFNNLKVGGRNLIRQSNVANHNATSASYDKNTATWTLTANAGTGDWWGAGLVLVGDNVRIPYGKTYVLSFEIKVPRACSWNIDVNNYAVTGSSWSENDNDNFSDRATSSRSLVANQWIKCWSRISNTASVNTNKVDIYDNSNFGVVMRNETSSMTYQIRNIQGEIGNIPSEYTPAPEDVQGQIDATNNNLATNYSTTSAMNSAIQQKANEITSSVSSTYATKQSVTDVNNKFNNYSTTTQMNSAINQKANQITSSVSQTYATKQSVTDVSNNLATNYSTTSAMNSAIQQKANEITSTVSQTYATKSEFNNLQIGGTNLIQNGNFKGAIASSTSMPNPWTFWGTEIHIYGSHGAPGYNHVGCVYIGCNLTDGRQSGIFSNRIHVSKVEKGANYMASFIFTMETNVKGAYAYIEYLNDACDQIVNSQVIASARPTANVVNGLNEHQYRIPFTMWTGDFSYVQIAFNHGGTNVPSNGYLMIVGNVQIEKGNKATDWSPAPEDVQGQIDATNNNLANNYSTTTQMNSAIQQKANEITSSVSETYTTKSETTAIQNQITTSRNLLIGSRDYNLGKWGTERATILDEWYKGTRIYTTSSEWASMDYYVSDLIDRGVIELFTPYTFSCYVMSTGSDYTPNIQFFGNGLPNYHGAYCGTASTSWQRMSITIEWSSLADRSYGIRFEAPTASPSGSHLRWACFQLERGKVATGWGPAPEDAQYGINDVYNNLVNNYSTTSAMNSAIQQKANEITSTVSQTYTTKSEFNNLQIGGKNLLLNSKRETSNNVYCIDEFRPTELFEVGEIYTASICVTPANGVTHIQPYISRGWSSLSNPLYVNGTTKKVVSITFTFYGYDSDKVPVDIYDNNAFVQFYRFPNDGTVTSNTTLHWVKVEKGAKATDWTPAPEDVQGQIDATNNNLATNYSTTSAMNSAIQQKANEITSSVSSTYATKQSVTDVNNKFNNYSTTTQMNSAINQKANQITSSVSQTYATKQSVTDVSNNLANNYSTTTSMNSIIQQTASDLTLKFSESGGYNLLQNGHADKGTSYWIDNGGGLGLAGGAGGGAMGNFFTTSLSQGIRYYDWVRLLPNTHYVYQAKIWANTTFNGNSAMPLHFWFSYDCVNNTGDGYTILDYQQNLSASNAWTQCYLHFVTGNSNIYFKPYIWNGGVTTSIFVTELMLSQSRVVQPWSPHPSEVYSGITQVDKDGIRVYHSNANSYTHMAPDGFFINRNGADVLYATSNGLYVQGNITSGSTIQGARITGSTFNSSNDVFQVLEDGTVETSYLAVNGAVSTDKLNVNDIENASYPKVLSEATTVYISPNGGVNAEEFYNGAYFTSLSNMLAVAPRNLNGYTLTIRMAGDLYENAALTWFHSGQVNFELQGHTLYGYFYGYGASMCYRLYGNTNANNDGTWGHIKPNVGRAMGSYYYAVQFQYCQFAVNYVAVYPSASSGSSSGGIGVHRGATGIILNAKACGNMRYLVRAEYAGRVHVNSTQGACNNATFCASTGGIITLNSSNSQAGRSTTGNPYWVGSGGLILCDQLLGMDKITFNNTAQSGSSSSSGSTTRKVTETVKASSADTYRSTVYNNWKGDGTVRQGDYGYGDCQGCWFFGNKLYTTMNAGTVTKVVIRIQRQSGGVNALQTLTVKSHNHTSRPSGAPTYTDTIGTCSCAVGSAIDLVITDTATINKLKNCKGLGLSIGSASSPYAVCSGACSVIITYTTNS